MRLLTVAVLLSLSLAGCGGESADPVGNPAVLERIAGMEDCAELQREFDTADAGSGEAATAYMRAADARMRAVGCY